MTNPVVVEVLRGAVVESRHRGSAVVCDAAGAIVLEFGDVDRPVFPRSAVKLIQALPLIETGAADAFGFGERELALACASHAGETQHAEAVSDILAKIGLEPDTLECGAHWPTSHRATVALAAQGGSPSALHNNCSGKHAGFLAVCQHCGIDHRGYVGAGHEMQKMTRAALADITGATLGEDVCGVDGCSIPTYAVPLRGLARGFAQLATGHGLAPRRVAAARLLMTACMAEPFMVAGTRRADTRMLEAGGGRVFVKTGAEGVYCAAIPELGLGIALKCDDGATRASEVMIASILAHLLRDDDRVDAGPFKELAAPTLRNWNRIEVGSIRAAGPLASL